MDRLNQTAPQGTTAKGQPVTNITNIIYNFNMNSPANGAQPNATPESRAPTRPGSSHQKEKFVEGIKPPQLDMPAQADDAA